MQHSKMLYEKGVLRNRKMLTQSQYSNFKFIGRLDNIKTLLAGLKALTFAEDGHVHINTDGFRVTAEDKKCVQASLFITPSCFVEYFVNDFVTFSVKLNVVTECLGMFSGIDCSMKMIYKGDGAPLIMILQPHVEDDVSTECSIKTTNYEEPMNITMDENSQSLNVIFVRGNELLELFQEIDRTAEEIEFTFSPRHPFFRMDTLGVMQSETSIEIAKTSDIIIHFNCRETTTARYSASQIRMTMKALAAATKVAFKTNSSGLLEMHFLIQPGDEAEIYIQFFITSLIDSTL